MTERLYEIPPYQGEDDYLSDLALLRIREHVLHNLPDGGFDMSSTNATTKGVTVTLRFAGADPMRHLEHLEAILQAATVTRTLLANLLAARGALASRGTP